MLQVGDWEEALTKFRTSQAEESLALASKEAALENRAMSLAEGQLSEDLKQHIWSLQDRDHTVLQFPLLSHLFAPCLAPLLSNLLRHASHCTVAQQIIVLSVHSSSGASTASR